MILHVILPCSLAASGRSLAVRLPAIKMATCTWPTTLPSFSTATACRSKEFSSSTAQQSFVDLSTQIHGGGGLNCEAKAQVLIVTLPPPFYHTLLGLCTRCYLLCYALKIPLLCPVTPPTILALSPFWLLSAY